MKERAVLIIDDEENILKTIRRELSLHGYHVFIANNAKEAFNALETESIPVVISDQRMPDITGSELLSLIKKRYPKTIRMIISGYTDFDALQEAINNGEIFKFIPKPWEEEYLITVLDQAFNYYDIVEKRERKSRALDNALEGIALTNLKNIIESVNITFLLISGYPKNKIIDKEIWELFPNINIEDQKKIMSDVTKNNSWQGETTLIAQNGMKIRGLLSISQIVDKQRNKEYRSFSFIDTSDICLPQFQLQNIDAN